MVDEPVIVTGGSVNVSISEKFKNDGYDKGKNKYKLDDRKLHSLWVNGEKVRDLTQTDTVSIKCEYDAAADATAIGGLDERGTEDAQ